MNPRNKHPNLLPGTKELKRSRLKADWLGITVTGAFLLFASMPSAPPAAQGKIKTFVSILPQAYFVERIGGPHVDIEVLVGPGQSPATYEPTPKQMTKLARAHLYFRIGVPFEEAFVPRIARTFRNLQIVDTRKGVQLRYFTKTGGPEIPDPHIWLDPKRVKVQAATIWRALSGVDPKYAVEFDSNLRTFQADLHSVDAKIADSLAPLKGMNFYVFHPAFGYFGDSYGLTQVAVEIAGKEPSPKQLTELIEKAKQDGVKVIFVQPQFARKAAETIARQIDGAVVAMNPLSRDYLRNLEDMAAAVKKALSRS